MKRAPFRLAPVLELRRTQERTAALAAASAAADAAEAARRADEQEERAHRALPPTGGPGAAFRTAMFTSRMAATDAADARALAVARAEQAELVRVRWTEAAQRTKGLEKLAERHALALALADDVAERRTVDDLVARQHADEEGDDPDGASPTTGSTTRDREAT